MLKPFTV